MWAQSLHKEKGSNSIASGWKYLIRNLAWALELEPCGVYANSSNVDEVSPRSWSSFIPMVSQNRPHLGTRTYIIAILGVKFA